jgi:recombination protein RecA
MPRENLQHAIGAIHVRFGDQALVSGARLQAAAPWPTGLPAVDRLSGIGGLPRGRVSVLRGALGSGKTSLALAMLARATREHAHVVVIDHVRPTPRNPHPATAISWGPRGRRFDPWIPDRMDADLAAMTLVRPPTPAVAGEAAVALARAGIGFALVLAELPEPALAPLESAAARSGSVVLAVADGEGRALAHASSLTLEVERVGWEREWGVLVGARSVVRCVKNKLAAPGAEAEVVLRYPLDALLPAREWPTEVASAAPEAGQWSDESAAG